MRKRMTSVTPPAYARACARASLDGFENGRFVAFGAGDDLPLGGFHGDGAFALTVHVQQLAQVEAGALQNL